MPFFIPENKQHHIIDESKYMPIAVICYTDTEGINTPLQFKMELPDYSRITVKINSIVSRKNIPAGYLYTCKSNVDGHYKLFDIIFFPYEGLWVIDKLKLK